MQKSNQVWNPNSSPTNLADANHCLLVVITQFVPLLIRLCQGISNGRTFRCSIRHLYTLKDVPQSQKDALIDTAKYMERRRCNHHIFDEPLSTLECLSSVIDPKKSLMNRNRYVVASQDDEVRRYCRGVKGVPLVYVKRSVMVMEPMSEGSADVREGIEKSKFRSGLRGRGTWSLGKRKRDGSDSSGSDMPESKEVTRIAEGDGKAAKKKKARGPKGPNPLSVKRSKKEPGDAQRGDEEQHRSREAHVEFEGPSTSAVDIIEGALDEAPNPPAKKKRKRKHKSKGFEELAATINSFDEADG